MTENCQSSAGLIFLHRTTSRNMSEMIFCAWQINPWTLFHSLVPGRFQWNFVLGISKLMVVIGELGLSSEIQIPLDLIGDMSTLVPRLWRH